MKQRKSKNVYKRRKGAWASESSNPENLRKIMKAQIYNLKQLQICPTNESIWRDGYEIKNWNRIK